MYLNCHTGFSFKYGTMQVKELFDEAKRCGVHKLILTEINNTSSYIEMLRLCAENAPVNDSNLTAFDKEAYELEIAVGIEFREKNELLYIAIARNNDGFEKINRFLSYHNLKGEARLPRRAPELEDVFIIYPFEKFYLNNFASMSLLVCVSMISIDMLLLLHTDRIAENS